MTKIDFENYFTFVINRYLKYNITISHPKFRSILKSYLNAKIKSIIYPKKLLKNSPKNWAALSINHKTKQSELRKRKQFPSIVNSPLLKSSLENIITLSKKHDFHIVGIKFPISKSYIKTLNGLNYGADKVFMNHNIKVLDYEGFFLFIMMNIFQIPII